MKKSTQILTAGQLRSLLSYDASTGVFTRLTKWGSQNIGDIPGSKSPQGYWQIGINSKSYPAHRLAWLYVYGEWPPGDVDHVNRDRSDNRLENLRVVTRSVNLHNSIGRKPSNVKGVSCISPTAQKRTKKIWRASIMVNYKRHHLGNYLTFEEAVEARRQAEQKLLETNT